MAVFQDGKGFPYEGGREAGKAGRREKKAGFLYAYFENGSAGERHADFASVIRP